ncbi:MAG TPA: macro domain-containing protein [Candidatus Polarisedimenticolia bacterium]|nr:macro domain-containing protein [Candidatus Polarisedimenticolia bacterium]
MKVRIGMSALELVEGDITGQQVDAIVNAANAQLEVGGSVDGAIHRAGGPDILAECRLLGGCPTGKAVATTAGLLSARHVIHAVGPIYRDGRQGEPDLLASAYRESFELAAGLGLKTVASSSLSTGAYGYPIDDAARVALGAAIDFLRGDQRLSLIRFVLYGRPTFEAYQRVLEEIAPTQVFRLP